MKIVIIGITTFLLCNTVGAQNLFKNYQFNKTEFELEMCLANQRLNSKKIIDNNSFIKTKKIKYPLLVTTSITPILLAAFSERNNSWYENMKPTLKARTIISAGLFIPTIASGYLMRNSNGNPNDGLLAIHKLSVVPNLVLLDATIWKKHKTTSLTFLESLIAITMNLSFVATITTGGLQSVNKTMPGWIHTSHQITPWITILSSGTMLFLLNK